MSWTLFFWRILRHSIVFRYWYVKFLNELLFDLELMDIEGKKIKEKYATKLERIKS